MSFLTTTNKNSGSTFNSFLVEEGILQEVTAIAKEKVKKMSNDLEYPEISSEGIEELKDGCITTVEVDKDGTVWRINDDGSKTKYERDPDLPRRDLTEEEVKQAIADDPDVSETTREEFSRAIKGRHKDLLEDMAKLDGDPPYNTYTNICWHDGYFALSLEAKYGRKIETLRNIVQRVKRNRKRRQNP